MIENKGNNRILRKNGQNIQLKEKLRSKKKESRKLLFSIFRDDLKYRSSQSNGTLRKNIFRRKVDQKRN